MRLQRSLIKEEVSSRLLEALLASKCWVQDKNGHYRTITSKGKSLRLILGRRTVVADVNSSKKYARRLRIASAFYSDVKVYQEDGKYRIFIGGIEL